MFDEKDSSEFMSNSKKMREGGGSKEVGRREGEGRKEEGKEKGRDGGRKGRREGEWERRGIEKGGGEWRKEKGERRHGRVGVRRQD